MNALPIELYTDGASKGNPGPGGYGVILRSGKHYKELSCGYIRTTNNRMELMAVIAGLEALKHKNSQVEVFSDSKYVVDAINKGWLFTWERKGFTKRLNSDLWIRFLKLYRQHEVSFHWVKGHADYPENIRCDTLAVEAAEKAISLPGYGLVDDGVEDKSNKTINDNIF